MPLMVGITADAHAVAFGPSDIAGLVGWWDASDVSTFTLTSGGPAFTVWRDKSATACHLDVVTGGTRDGTISGLTSVVVPTGQAIRNVSTPATTATDNFTMFSVCRRTGGHATDCIVLCNGNVNANGYGFGVRAGGANTGFVRAGIAWHASATADGGTTNAYSAVRSAGTWSHYMNGIATTATSTAAPATPSRMTIVDSPHPFAGDLCEFLIYNVALNTTDRQAVENYLRTRWGTA